MIRNGEYVLWVSPMTGHLTSEMTQRRYVKYIKKEKMQRATFLNKDIDVSY